MHKEAFSVRCGKARKGKGKGYWQFSRNTLPLAGLEWEVMCDIFLSVITIVSFL